MKNNLFLQSIDAVLLLKSLPAKLSRRREGSTDANVSESHCIFYKRLVIQFK